MTEYRLPIDIYTPQAVLGGIEAFAHLCAASGYQEDDHTILNIHATDHVTHFELLNYILTLSAQLLLEQ